MKIKANELRWGNYLEINGEAVEIRHIGSAWLNHHVLSDAYKSASRKTRIQEYKPIKVTEDWLSKLGFQRTKSFSCHDNVWSFEGILVSLGDYDNFHVDWAEESDGEYCSIRCYEDMYVHQLQNLYYALEGKEL